MLQAQRMADLVRRELTQPVERQTEHRVVVLVGVPHLGREARVAVRRHQALAHEVILAHAPRAEGDVPVHDLARRRIAQRAPVRQAARLPVNPLDDVDVHVVDVDVVREHLDDELLAREPEGLAPVPEARDGAGRSDASIDRAAAPIRRARAPGREWGQYLAPSRSALRKGSGAPLST